MSHRSPEPTQPVLRHLDLHRVEEHGRSGVVLVDPLGLVEGTAFVPDALLPVIALFDGIRNVADIARTAAEASGQDVPEDFVRDLVRQLDEGLLLNSPLFRNTLAQTAKAFVRQDRRPARHAGTAGYPEDPAACAVRLREIVPAARSITASTPRGLIAPHIDLARGADGYRAAYGHLASCAPADLYVIFGTGHQGPGAPVTGLAMDWETPIGTVATDREFVATVHASLGAADPVDVFLHRDEHSLEFQVLFLRHVLGDRDFQVAGFLTGHLPPHDDDPTVRERLYTAFRDAIGDRKVCFIAGADLAHVGPFFGDPATVDDARLERLERDERARLAHLAAASPDAFWDAIERAENPDRVCGTTPIVLTAALASGPATILHYGQARAPDNTQTVSFCSAVFD